MALIDQIKNAAMPAAGLHLQLTNRGAGTTQQFVTVADWIAAHHGDRPELLKTPFTSAMGKIASALYRARHDDAPRTIKKQVNGAMRKDV